MKNKLQLKLILDLCMTILMLLAFAYQLTGNLIHEWIGVAIFALLITHNLINKRWYKVFYKGNFSLRRWLSNGVNFLLLADMAILAISSLLVSRDIFAFLLIDSGVIARQLHVLTSYWGLIFLSIHIGLHWSLILGVIQRQSKIAITNPFIIWIFRGLAILIAAYGVNAFIDMNIGQKLILYYSFDYWDFETAALLFFINLLATMGLFICITYYSLEIIGKRKRLLMNSLTS